MKLFGSFLLLLFLTSCGSRSSPPDIQTITKVEKIKVSQVLLQQYPDPPEPEEKTVGALINYILEQRAVNARHNKDKRDIADLQE